MPFTNKKVQLTDFMEQLRKRIEAGGNSVALIFFDVFLKEGLVIKAVKEYPGLDPNWDGRVNAGDFNGIYPMAVEILHDAASRNFSKYSNTYADAHAVSVAFCEELNEFFECSGEEKFDLMPIKSFVDMAVEAGVVEVEGGKVKLTPMDCRN
jgi:hypothetical protein